jgi:methanogenic corrinoid protein MtbC1
MREVNDPGRESNRVDRSGVDPLARSRRSRIRRLVEGELLPRFLISHHAGPMPPSFIARAAEGASHPRFDEFLTLVRAPSTDDEVRGWLEELLDEGQTVETVLAELLAPVARRMGALWDEDECDFFEVTLVCNRLQRAIRRLASRFRERSPSGAGSVLVTALPHAQHTLGMLMVSETLARYGFDVSLGDPFVPGVDPFGFDVVALSVTRSEEVSAAETLIADIRRRAPGAQILVGGAVFREDPGLISRIGADGWAEDAVSTLTLVREMTSDYTSRVARQA